MVAERQREEIWTPDVLLGERARLVRLCAYLTGDPDVAEDLAQETLIEAWRHIERLHDPSGVDRWLAAIARNVCRRWQRRRGRERTHLLLRSAASASVPEAVADDEGDLAVELERDELAALLDKALALLPAETRAALVARYIEGSPQAEIAARLGMSEGAVAVRLHRGKLTLRRLLVTDFREDAMAYGFVAGEPDGWVETRIWCPRCGQHRLRAWLDRDPREGAFLLRCPRCYPNERDGLNVVCTYFVDSPGRVSLLAGVKGWRPMLSRVMADTHNYYREGLPCRTVPCIRCGRPVPIRHWWEPASSLHPAMHGIEARCHACHGERAPNESLTGLVLDLPEGRRFWRAYPRIRALPEREVEAGGIPALVTAYESIPDGARFTVVSARDTYQIISINGEPVRE
jgi:RNA polymerase sigma factor (sigma-70 family)